jgi:succinyl-CoA synthetase beta subunit
VHGDRPADAHAPDIVEVDVNPLMVHAKGQGVTALDALIVANRKATMRLADWSLSRCSQPAPRPPHNPIRPRDPRGGRPAAGSGGDVIARFYADKLAQLSGKPVVVENKPGMILSTAPTMSPSPSPTATPC